MLSKQGELSMLNGDFDHFHEDTAELLAEKEVGTACPAYLAFAHAANFEHDFKANGMFAPVMTYL